MKNIFTLLTIFFLAGTVAVNAQQTSKTNLKNKTILVYSEEQEALVYKNQFQSNDGEIMIESLPAYGQELIPIEINQTQLGWYTFTKHPALVLPEYYSVLILDSLTGKTFDLKGSDSYTFSVTKSTPERFMLQITKTKITLTALR